jgi:hypothetical protein
MSDNPIATRLFTVEEANALLPDLEPILAELQRTFREVRGEIEAAAAEAGVQPGSPDLTKHLEARGRAPELFARVKTLIDRVHARGCLVNGPEAGLVDFPCLFNNEIVFLCWKYGEPRVLHWHRIPDGFAGRRPLLEAGEAGDGGRIH